MNTTSLRVWLNRLDNGEPIIRITDNNPGARMLVIGAMILLGFAHGLCQTRMDMLGITVILNVVFTVLLVKNSIKRAAKGLTYTAITLSLITGAMLLLGNAFQLLLIASNYDIAEMGIRFTNAVVCNAGLMTYPWVVITMAIVDLLTSGKYPDENEEPLPTGPVDQLDTVLFEEGDFELK